MKLNKTLQVMHDLFVEYAPLGAALLDFIKRKDEFIILYRDDRGRYTICHLDSNGLYNSRYYANYLAAHMYFRDIK